MLTRITLAGIVCWLALAGCAQDDLPPIEYQCGTVPTSELPPLIECAADDPELATLKPQWPTEICGEPLRAMKSGPREDDLDTRRVQDALNACKGGVVKLVTDGQNNAFVTGPLIVNSATLWVDKGVTLFASRDFNLYQKTGNCGVMGINDSGACTEYISVGGTSPGIIGEGTIDGQGGEPLVGRDYSWWQLSYALRPIDGSIGNPTLINVTTGTTGLLLFGITLHNSPKFHVKITSMPADGLCDRPGKGFTVWGVTVLTPSTWQNSRGEVLTPSFARNTDGIDPGANSAAFCGLMVCNTISTGDDHIAIKGGHWVSDLIIAHNHFGTGHGMSIGSETFGSTTTKDGVQHRGVENVTVYDLTIDATSRPVGYEATAADFNGIRVKSDESRGGLVNNITYRDVCMRDTNNAILVSTAYNPLFAGTVFPDFRKLTFHNIRHVTCMAKQRPVVTLEGFNAARPVGPVTLDNVIIDNVGPLDIAAEFADITLGPGEVNFVPRGRDVTLHDVREPGSVPRACVFPTLPTPKVPEGWLR